MLALELLNEVIDETVVEVLTTKVSITSSSLDLEDTLFNSQERNIESSSTEIEDENVTFTNDLLVETIGNGGGSRLFDDTENVQTGDGSGILGGLTLRIVEVGRHGHDSVGDGGAEIGLCGLLHFGEDHGGDFLGGELLGLVTVLDLDVGLASLIDALKREVLEVGLNLGVGELAANETLGIEDTGEERVSMLENS